MVDWLIVFSLLDWLIDWLIDWLFCYFKLAGLKAYVSSLLKVIRNAQAPRRNRSPAKRRRSSAICAKTTKRPRPWCLAATISFAWRARAPTSAARSATPRWSRWSVFKATCKNHGLRLFTQSHHLSVRRLLINPLLFLSARRSSIPPPSPYHWKIIYILFRRACRGVSGYFLQPFYRLHHLYPPSAREFPLSYPSWDWPPSLARTPSIDWLIGLIANVGSSEFSSSIYSITFILFLKKKNNIWTRPRSQIVFGLVLGAK